MTSNVINISDDQYYRDFSDRVGAIQEDLSKQNRLGIFIDGPKKIDGGLHDSLPILAIEHRTFEQGGKANYSKHATVIGIDVERNIVYANKAIEHEDNYVEQAPVSLPGEPLEVPAGSYAKYEVFDARARLGFMWRAGYYQFYVALQDEVYGPINVEISFTKNTGTDPVASTLSSQLMSPLPGNPLPNYLAIKKSPPSPGEHGIALSIAPSTVLRNDSVIPVYGTFWLKPLLSEKVSPDDWRARVEAQSRDDKTLKAWLQSDREMKLKQLANAPSAVIPITLVILGSVDGYVTSFTVRAPSYGTIADDGTVRGNFALDLSRVPGMSKAAQTYYFYAVSGEIIEKPVISEFAEAVLY